MILDTQQQVEQAQPSPAPEFCFAVVAAVHSDGLSLYIGAEKTPTQKHYKCNTSCRFSAGQKVYIQKAGGEYIVLFPIGNQGTQEGGGTPPGTVAAFAGSTAPAGWLLCDGSAVSRTAYADLFAVIGTTYGAGNGSTTFALPDLRGRVAAGANASNALASRAGADSKQIARANLPAEKLNLEDNGTWIVDSVQTGSESGKTLQMGTRSGAARLETNTLGSGTAFDVRQATMYVHYIIKC